MHNRTHIHIPTSLGDKIADKVAASMGSWRFIIIQSILLIVWATLNSVGWWIWKWDAYPFIAMNLLLSCQAAYATPLIMMSQNRQGEKDHKRDDLEAHEVSELFSINKTQLEILKQQSDILDLLKAKEQS